MSFEIFEINVNTLGEIYSNGIRVQRGGSIHRVVLFPDFQTAMTGKCRL